MYIFLNLAGREDIEKEKRFLYAPAVLNLDGSIRVPAESRKICATCGNVVMERHKFNTRTQIQGEQFQSFVADLRIDHFTVVAKLPGLRMEARLPVTLL